MIQFKLRGSQRISDRDPRGQITPVENPVEMQRRVQDAITIGERIRESSLAEVAYEMSLESIERRQRDLYFNEMQSIGLNPISYSWDLIGLDAALNGKVEEEPKVEIEPPTEYETKVSVVNRSGAYGDSRTFRYENNKGAIMSMNQIPFPNCCGVCILKDFSLDNNVTQAQFNDFMEQSIKSIEGTDFFGKAVIYTWSPTGDQERLISNYPNIEILDKMNNPRTGHMVSGYEIQLKNER